MALYAIVAYDKPNGLAHRMEVRPDHLKHLDALGDSLVLAGPFLDENGDMNGSFMVVEAENQKAAEAAFGRDPFITRGVFASYDIKPWRLSINNTAK